MKKEKIKVEVKLFKEQDLTLPGEINRSEASSNTFILNEEVAHLRVEDITVEELSNMSFLERDIWLKYVDDFLIYKNDYAKDYILTDTEKYRVISNEVSIIRKKAYEVYKIQKRINPLYSIGDLELDYYILSEEEFGKGEVTVDVMYHYSYEKLLDYKAKTIAVLNIGKKALNYTYLLRDTEEYKEAKKTLISDRFESLKRILLHLEQIDRCIRNKEKYYKK